MFCPKCGTAIGAGAAACPSCGTPVNVSIKSHLADAILVTIFCCWPFGIPAIVFAAKTNSYIRQGKIPEAQAASKQAAIWTYISLGLGLAGVLVWILIRVLLG